MNSFRTYKFDTKLTNEKILEKLLEISYKENGNIGFVIEECNDYYLTGEYCIKRTIEQKNIDPFGDEYINSFIKIDEYKFKMFFEKSIILLENPATSLSTFFTRFGIALDYQITFELIGINLNKFIMITQNFVDAIDIKSVDISGIYFSEKVKGIATISGEKEVMKYVESLNISKFPIQIKKMKMNLQVGSINTNIISSAKGTIWLSEKDTPRMRDLLEEIILNYN